MGEKLKIDGARYRKAVEAVVEQNAQLHRFCGNTQLHGVDVIAKGWNYEVGADAVKNIVNVLNQTINGLDNCWYTLVDALNKYGEKSADYYHPVPFNHFSGNAFEVPKFDKSHNVYDEDLLAKGILRVERTIINIKKNTSEAYTAFSSSGVEGTGVQEYFSAFRSATSKAGNEVERAIKELSRTVEMQSKTFGSKLAKARNEAIKTTTATSMGYWRNN